RERLRRLLVLGPPVQPPALGGPAGADEADQGGLRPHPPRGASGVRARSRAGPRRRRLGGGPCAEARTGGARPLEPPPRRPLLRTAGAARSCSSRSPTCEGAWRRTASSRSG